jgi:hypothetical protein
MSGIESGIWAVIRRIFGGWLRGSESELTSTLISRSGYNIIFLLLRKVPIIISLDLAELFGIIIIVVFAR